VNYAQARERQLNGKPLGRWDWTTMNSHVVRRSEPCAGRTCTHQTHEEAERHFYSFCLERATIHEHADEQRKCVICGAWTTTEMGNNQMWLCVRPVDLCDEHLTREFLAQAVPFSPGLQIIHS
jgi:hypothetical protein